MKAASVAAAALCASKHVRIDAKYFLGQVDGQEQSQEVEVAKRHVGRSLKRLESAVQQQTAAAARTRRLIESGEIVPIESEEGDVFPQRQG